MKIFDVHIHGRSKAPNPEKLIAEMDKAGVYGGCVFSAPPKEHPIDYYGGGSSYDERIDEVMGWCKGYEDRLFPVLWIHPNEKDILNIVHDAVKKGIVAFKMICFDYFIYEEKPMQVVREIAKIGKPIFFHTGILWDGLVSSEYNRPLNWEALLDVEGIKFSMGHVSWPWVDECIALAGKIYHAQGIGKDVEMFFDTTPGTPEIYRKELLTKLYTIGYNVGDNVLFGTDNDVDEWNDAWALEWLERDRIILDELGVSKENREKLYYKNLLRFLGKGENKKVEPSCTWKPYNPKVKEIIEKWYKRLEFPIEYDKEFYQALDSIPISDAITLEKYDLECKDGKRNLLSCLFMCEETERKCKEKSIPDEIITQTLKDIVNWCINWSNVKGELYLGELNWLNRHLNGNIFQIGRLQFAMAKTNHDIPSYGVKAGDNVIEIHIPQGKSLTVKECENCIENAKIFFEKYFPQFNYTVFTCSSWLLDETLKEYLSADSGIIQFGNMFDKVDEEESNALIRYLFAWDTTILNIQYRHPVSSFAEKVKKAVLKGVKFHETLGVIKK